MSRHILEAICGNANSSAKPFFHEGAGITLASFAIDTLRTLYLGPALEYCCHCLWLLILHDILGTGARGGERKVLSVLRIRGRLWEWCAQQRRDKPHESRTQVEDFTAAMLGTESKPSLGTKGMETAGLVPFCVCMMVEHGATIGDVARSAQACGEALMQLVSILGSSPRRMSDDDVQKMYDATKRLRLWHLCEFKKTKLHFLVHMVQRAARAGNPTYYSTVADEGLNKVLAAIARAAHRSVWELRIFSHFQQAETFRTAKRKVR